jgi:predicted RNA binding protein YcfA (HicA-like mRNA interferase family)
MGTQRLPQVNGRRVIQALRKAGWRTHRVRGSHHVLVHPERPEITIVVPVHTRPMKKGALADILDQARLSIPEFIELL